MQPLAAYSPEVDKMLTAYANQATNNNSNICIANVTLDQSVALPPELLQVIHHIANTGLTCYPWQHLKILIAHKLNQNLREYASRFTDQTAVVQLDQKRLAFLAGLDSFINPPFTIQRICELAVGTGMYKLAEKYIFALQKLVAVNSTEITLNPTDYNHTVVLLAQIHHEHRLQCQQEEKNRQTVNNFPNGATIGSSSVAPDLDFLVERQKQAMASVVDIPQNSSSPPPPLPSNSSHEDERVIPMEE